MAKAKKAATSEALPSYQRPSIPPALVRLRATLRQLESKSVQKKILAHYAMDAMVTTMDSYIKAAQEGNMAACNSLAEMYNLKEPKNGVSIVTNVDNRSVTVEEGPDRSIVRSFAGIARGFAEERERRRIAGGPGTTVLDATVVDTPLGPRAD